MDILDDKTVRISSKWEFLGKNGDVIRPSGLDAVRNIEPDADKFRSLLSKLIMWQYIGIKEVHGVDGEGVLEALVCFNGIDLADILLEEFGI